MGCVSVSVGEKAWEGSATNQAIPSRFFIYCHTRKSILKRCRNSTSSLTSAAGGGADILQDKKVICALQTGRVNMPEIPCQERKQTAYTISGLRGYPKLPCSSPVTFPLAYPWQDQTSRGSILAGWLALIDWRSHHTSHQAPRDSVKQASHQSQDWTSRVTEQQS